MSTLQQSLQQRRAVEPSGLVSVSSGAQTPGLMIATWQGKSWVLPWSYLVSAHWDNPEGQEQLVLTFTGHVVIVRGRNLQPVLVEVAAFRLGCLRDLPAEYGVQFPDDVPFVSGIDVRAASLLGPA